MKKFLFAVCSLVVCGIMLTSCRGDDENEVLSLVGKDYVEVANAIYQEGTFPISTINESLEDVKLNSTDYVDGSGVISIFTHKAFKRFFIGVKDVPGYWTFVPVSTRADDYDDFYYEIPFDFGEISDSFVILISGEDENGDTTKPYEQVLNYVEQSAPVGKITSIRIQDFNIYSMKYDDMGRLTWYSEFMDDEALSISYNPLRLNYFGEDIWNMSTDSRGYVTRITDEDGSSYLTYDSSGCLTKWAEGGLYYTWQNGDLVKVELREDDKVEIVVTATYGDDLNVAAQGSVGLADLYLEHWMCFTDLFGKQSKHLPTSIKRTDNGEITENYTITYDFNRDGTIKTEYLRDEDGVFAAQYSYGSSVRAVQSRYIQRKNVDKFSLLKSWHKCPLKMDEFKNL